MTKVEIEEIARRQLADYDAHRPGTIFADAGFQITVEEAFAVQYETARLRAARGEAIAGYKIGCISEAIQRQFGLRTPAFGRLFASEMHRSGATLDLALFDSLAIEGEFAVRIAEDLSDAERLFDDPQRWIAAVFSVIELHNHVFRRTPPTAAELIANNALHAGVILPAEECPFAAGLDNEPIAVLLNGVEVGTTKAGTIPGGPLASVYKIAEHLAESGTWLKKGDLVLTGSPLPLYGVESGDAVAVRTGSRGSVSVSFGRSRR